MIVCAWVPIMITNHPTYACNQECPSFCSHLVNKTQASIPLI